MKNPLAINPTASGEALNGKVADARYDGHYREVSHAFFVYSSLDASLPMVGIWIVGLVALRRRRHKRHSS